MAIMYKVEDVSVEVRKKKKAKVLGESKTMRWGVQFDSVGVGQSFLVPFGDGLEATKQRVSGNVRGAVGTYMKGHPGVKFRTRVEKDEKGVEVGIRVGRVADVEGEDEDVTTIMVGRPVKEKG